MLLLLVLKQSVIIYMPMMDKASTREKTLGIKPWKNSQIIPDIPAHKARIPKAK